MTDATATTNGELHTEDEALSVLLDGDIDKVMSGLDKIVEAAPSYEKLFMRWQRQHWSTEDFTFEVDKKQWADPDMFTDDERRFLEFGFSEFFLGEERVTLELLPFALAAPTHEAKVFLTTQISDEAKHTVFWNGFYREVFGIEAGSLGEMIDKQRYVVNDDWETLFNGILHECAEDLRKDPSDFPKLVRGVTVYMIVIEGMLALSAARFMIKSLREKGWFPGFTAGLLRKCGGSLSADQACTFHSASAISGTPTFALPPERSIRQQAATTFAPIFLIAAIHSRLETPVETMSSTIRTFWPFFRVKLRRN